MKLVQKVLSHGLLIAFFVAVFFIYMNRMELFPQWFARPAPATTEHSRAEVESPATVASQVPRPNEGGNTQDIAPEKLDTVVSESVGETPAAAPEDDQAQVSAEVVPPAVEPHIPASADSEPVFRPIPETEPVAETEPVEAAASVSGNEAGSQQADVVSAPMEEAVADIEEENVVSTEQVVTEQGAAAGQDAAQDSAAADDFQGRLEQARAYFWQRDMRAALQTYQSLAESYPERAEVWGELGNLYFNIRRTSDAMDAYAHAAELLKEQGDAEGASELLNVMYRLDAERASQIEMHLRKTGGGVAADGR